MRSAYWMAKTFVTLREGASTTADDIIAHCKQLLAHFKVPRQIEFGPLPKTSTGKVQKYVLRDKEWKGQAKRIHSPDQRFASGGVCCAP